MTWTVLDDSTPKARKPHSCESCDRVIEAGEVYLRIRYIDAEFGPGTWKECAHCRAVRARIHAVDPDARYYDEGIYLRDYLDEAEGAEWRSVAQQFRRRWRSALGELLPVPTWPSA